MTNHILLVMILAGLGLASCNENQRSVTAEQKTLCVSDSLAKMIRIDTAIASKLKNELKLNGQVSFDEGKVVSVVPVASGQVTAVKVSLGDKVSRGQVLAIIRSADIAGSYADLSASKADLAIAKRQLQQVEYLYNNGISSEREYIEAKENFNKALAAKRRIEDQIAINGGGNTDPAGMLSIKAPRDGYIVSMNISAGNFIRPDNNEALFIISDMKNVWIKADVYETDIAKIKLGNTAYISTLAYPDKTFIGKIDHISSVLDPDTKVMSVRIALPNTEMLLKPEMFAMVRVVDEDAEVATAVPSRAVIFDQRRNYVVLYKDSCNLEVREVSVLKTVESTIYLRAGLRPGDKVVSKNQLLLFSALSDH